MEYDKLVRDKIPKIIKGKGKIPKTHIASKKEYYKKLKEKLQEEVDEFLKAETKEEFADVLEVLDAIGNFKKFTRKEILYIKNKKAEERGRFCEKVILEKVE